MKNSLPISRIILFIALLCAAIYGVSVSYVNESLIKNNDCDITASECVFSAFNRPVSVKFEQAPVAEEELFIRFELSDDIVVQNSWIEGVNMYMGKTPVLFESAQDNNRAVTFLGSCNLSEMHWVMFIELKNNATGEVALKQATFSSYQP
ncbi:hypothetical protein ACFO4O_04600 [Glaciecola siphonariae]|uniref:Uncharacterized protein n=1 Tax=Glaciecola siphonariae TaxID=521012 RepID=A0ABV9LUB1_9ALTE